MSPIYTQCSFLSRFTIPWQPYRVRLVPDKLPSKLLWAVYFFWIFFRFILCKKSRPPPLLATSGGGRQWYVVRKRCRRTVVPWLRACIVPPHQASYIVHSFFSCLRFSTNCCMCVLHHLRGYSKWKWSTTTLQTFSWQEPTNNLRNYG